MKYLTFAITILALGLAGCGSSSATGSTQSTTVKLTQVPKGTTDVSYDASTRKLTLTVRATGLTPSSPHLWGIGLGTCATHKGPFHPDPSRIVTADEHGVAEASAVINDVDGVPNPSFVHIHQNKNGPASPHESRGLVCADLTGPVTGAALSPEPADGTVTGTVTLTLDSSAKTLTVKVSVDGLAPGANHPNHIHNGRCEQEGPVAYGLTALNADQSGHADATTTLSNVASIGFGSWYVNVHQGPTLDDADQFTPITCGNVSR
jgi:hypothetical protein